MDLHSHAFVYARTCWTALDVSPTRRSRRSSHGRHRLIGAGRALQGASGRS
jgi:hypothetical protein